MPKNKNHDVRIRILNECFSTKGKYWSKKQLIEIILKKADINVCERTIDLDIQAMRSSGQLKYFAPIEYCKTRRGYYYSDPNYSVDKLPLTNDDIKALELAATTLKQYQYIPIMKEFTITIDKIIRVVNRAKQSNHESILDFIEFEKTPISAGLNFIDTLIDSIQGKKALNLEHQKFGAITTSQQIVHPYFLKEYRNRWYVIGLNENKKKIQTYGLDRIKSLSKSRTKYLENTSMDTKKYLGDCVGINLMEQKVETVKLLFTTKEGYYIKSQPIHKSQKIIQDSTESGLLLECDLIINYELIGIILSYGSDVKVIEPKSLASKVIEISERNIQQYSNIS